MAVRFGNVRRRHFDSSGQVLGGGKLNFYEKGTTTRKDTYSDVDGATPNANPVVLSSGGLEPDIFLDGVYRVILTDSDDVQIWDIDDVNSESGFAFQDWLSSISYGSGGDNIVTGSDGNYYVSTSSSNLSNDPTTSPSDWTQFELINVTDAQAALLEAIGGLTPTDSNFIVGDGSTWVAETGATLRTSIGVGTGDTPQLTNVRLTGLTTGHVVTANSAGGFSAVDMTTKGDILAGDGAAAPSVLPVGNDNEFLTADSGEATGMKWSSNTLGDNYIGGMELSNNSTDSDHDIDVTSGTCQDSTNASRLTLSATITKQIDATWASGDDAGGLASGATLSTNTWYHVFAVLVSGSTDVMFDTSVTCANGVANNSVTAFRRIGSILTDGSSNITAFFQEDDEFYWDVPVRDENNTDPGTSAVTVTLTVPIDVKVKPIATFNCTIDGAVIQVIITNPDMTDTAASATTATAVIYGDGEAGQAGGVSFVINRFTDTSAQIRYRLSSSSANTIAVIHTSGWKDKRGQ